MSRIFNRPMFKRGGSAGQGITSGLDRPGYANGLDVQKVKELRDQTLGMYGQPPRGYGVYDFLTDWGLRMASATPKGNVLQTAASEAIEPHQKLMAGKSEAEMAEYLAGIKATDLSISSLTDIAAAQAKAREFNKDFTKERRKEDMQQEIFTKAQPGSFGSTWSGAAGMADGTVEINDLKKLLGDPNLPVDLITMTDVEGKGVFTFDPKALDDKKVWYDPNKKGWMIIVTTTDAEGKEGVTTQYFNTFDKAYKNLGKTTTSKKPGQLGEPTTTKKTDTGFFGNKRTTQEEYEKGIEETTEKIKSRFTTEGDIMQGDVGRYNVNLKNIVKNEQKKAEVEKDYNELEKWWKGQDTNLAYGYQGVN